MRRPDPLNPRVRARVPGFDAPFFLAGLVGYSDGPMRLVSRHHGCPFCVTESLSAETLVRRGRGLRRVDPREEAARLASCGDGDLAENRAAAPEDHPLAAQIIGSDPGTMAEAASLLAEMDFEVIDVNLACPPKKRRKSAFQGGILLSDADHAIEVLRAVRSSVPVEVVASVKLRRAYDDTPEMARGFDRIFDAAFEHGYEWATVHCRTVEQKYVGPARWSFLADLVQRFPDRIIFGSGDVWRVQDIFSMRDETGVDAVAVARGGIANPWIFRQAREVMEGTTPSIPDPADLRETLDLHCRLARALLGEKRAAAQMRKFGIKFADRYSPDSGLREAFIRSRKLDDWTRALDAHLPRPASVPGNRSQID